MTTIPVKYLTVSVKQLWGRPVYLTFSIVLFFFI